MVSTCFSGCKVVCLSETFTNTSRGTKRPHVSSESQQLPGTAESPGSLTGSPLQAGEGLVRSTPGGTDTLAAPSEEEGGPCANDVSLNDTSVTRDFGSVTVGSGKQYFDYLYAEQRASPSRAPAVRRPTVCQPENTAPWGVGGP